MTRSLRIASALLLASALCPASFAADIQPIQIWTGFHAGVGVGYGMVNHELELDAPALPGSLDFSGIGGEGGLATVELGYDVEVGANFLIGVAADYTYSGISTDVSGTIAGLGSADYELEATHAISAIVRGGRVVNDHTLLYSLAGWTRTWWNGDLSESTLPAESYSYETDGLTLGGGIESVIAKNVTVKLEYRYTMNQAETIFEIPGPVSLDENANQHTARVVLSYRPGILAKDFDGSEMRWTGLRAGFGGGYSMINHVLDATAPGFAAELSGIGGEGFFGAVELGYDVLIGERFVAGVQVDYAYSMAKTQVDATCFCGSLDYELQGTHNASALLRAGVLSNSDVLWFGVAGYTHTWFNGDLAVAPTGFNASYDFDQGGLTVGGGVEVMLSDNWSWKAEYRYTSLDDVNIVTLGPLSLDAATNIQQARTVLTYRF